MFIFWMLLTSALFSFDQDFLRAQILEQKTGAYLIFQEEELEIAQGKKGDFWEQMALRNWVEAASFPSFSPSLAKQLLSSAGKERCLDFFRFLQTQNLLFWGEIPQETKELLFGEERPFFEDKYKVVILLDEKKHWKSIEGENAFILDLSDLKEPLCEWPIEMWKKWIKPDIKIVFTSALIPHKFSERKEEYIHSLNLLAKWGLKEAIYVIESGGFSPLSFFDDYSDHVFYANTNDPKIRNKGVNEAKSCLSALSYFPFADEDLLIKLTGRYFFNSDDLFETIRNHPNVDAIASVHPDPNRGVTTGCFVMRAKYFKKMLKELDLEKMENEQIDIEWEVASFLKKIEKEGAYVLYRDKMGITANVANDHIEYW